MSGRYVKVLWFYSGFLYLPQITALKGFVAQESK